MTLRICATKVPLNQPVVLFPPGVAGNVADPEHQCVRISGLWLAVTQDRYCDEPEVPDLIHEEIPMHADFRLRRLAPQVTEIARDIRVLWDTRDICVRVLLHATWDHNTGSVFVKQVNLGIASIDVPISQGRGKMSLAFGTGKALTEYLERNMSIVAVDVCLSRHEEPN